MKKIVIIGLDGATFDLMRPWAYDGKLPIIKKLMDGGCWGELESTIPPLSPPAWASFMTGKNPGKHGIFDFTEMKPQSYDYRLINASDIRGSRFWEIAGLHGKSVCVINVPMTYPPRPVNGILVSGMDAPGVDSGITYPPELIRKLKSKFGKYVIEAGVWGYVRKGQYAKALSKSMESIALRTRIGKYLFQKEAYDLFVVVFPETDRIQHFFWKFMDPLHPMHDPLDGQKYGDAILQTYKACERAIGEFIDAMDDDTLLMVVSDHGGAGLPKKTFCLNRWLESEGFLAFKSGHKPDQSLPSKRGRSIARSIIEWIDFQGKKILPRSVKERLLRMIPSLHEKLETRLRFSNLNWDKTRVYADELRSNLRINLDGREPKGIVQPGEEYEKVRNSLIEKLTVLHDPETGSRIVNRVLRREEIYKGPMLNNAPDLSVILNKDYATTRWEEMEVDHYLGELTEREKKRRANAEHAMNGVFIIHGKDVQAGKEIKGAKLVDIAPTVLYLLGAPIPDDMDGQILTEAVAPAFLSSRPIEHFVQPVAAQDQEEYRESYTKEDSDKIMERLRGLGYLE